MDKQLKQMRSANVMAACLAILMAGPVACAAGPVPDAQPATGTPTQVIPSLPPFATSGHTAFDAWRDDFSRRAVLSGRDPIVVYDMLRDLEPLSIYLPENAVAGPNKSAISEQAEFAKPVWEYLRTAVSENRKSNGARYLAEEATLFDRIEAEFGVSGPAVAAIWAMETNFGGYIGDFDGPETLANMAVEGRRRQFAEAELTAAMKLVEQGLVERRQLVSGWAGAMGQTQFMPSTFLAYAVDFSGDGRRDLWTNNADALASAANYLKASGYVADEPWGLEVIAPVNFDFSLADGTRRSASEWAGLGLVPMKNDALEALSGGAERQARLWLPAGATGPKYLLFKNFDVFLTYNRSNSYALSVGLLADAMQGQEGPVTPWPKSLQTLSVAEVKQLQEGLNQLGFNAGAVDGIAGTGTRRALQSFQKDRGMRADGYPTRDALAYIMSEASRG